MYASRKQRDETRKQSKAKSRRVGASRRGNKESDRTGPSEQNIKVYEKELGRRLSLSNLVEDLRERKGKRRRRSGTNGTRSSRKERKAGLTSAKVSLSCAPEIPYFPSTTVNGTPWIPRA